MNLDSNRGHLQYDRSSDDAHLSMVFLSIAMLHFSMGTNLPDNLANLSDISRRLDIEAELERILASSVFRTSKRSQEFLRYIVNTALDGRTEDLKERVIGIEVFQRCPDYDTGEHSIVRVKANELRKRLAQFYAESHAGSMQILLPRGSYIPEFRWPEGAGIDCCAAAVHQPERTEIHFGVGLWVAAISALFLAASAAYFILHAYQSGNLEARFWRPILQDTDQPLICVADPEVLKLDEHYNALSFNGTLPAYVPASELVRDSSHYVGWGDAVALTRISTFFALHHKEPGIRTGNDVSFTDLSQAPLVLIGARSNQWTMQLANNLHFVFDRTETGSFIRDKEVPGKKWAFQIGSPKVDYLVITRLFESKTGRMIVLAAGLSHYGTQMAGEILTNPAYLGRALRDAPRDWERRNMQLLFRVEVFGESAAPPTLEASTYW